MYLIQFLHTFLNPYVAKKQNLQNHNQTSAQKIYYPFTNAFSIQEVTIYIITSWTSHIAVTVISFHSMHACVRTHDLFPPPHFTTEVCQLLHITNTMNK